MVLLVDEGFKVRESGELVAGSLVCGGGGYSVGLGLDDELPSCPACGETRFRRASLFESRTLDTEAISPAAAPPLRLDEGRPQVRAPPRWRREARPQTAAPSRYLPYEEDGEPVVFELSSGWTRIGRSSA